MKKDYDRAGELRFIPSISVLNIERSSLIRNNFTKIFMLKRRRKIIVVIMYFITYKFAKIFMNVNFIKKISSNHFLLNFLPYKDIKLTMYFSTGDFALTMRVYPYSII